MNSKEGGTVELNGNLFTIDPDDTRIHGVLWANGAMIEVFFHPEPVEGEHISDRLRLRITDCNQDMREWHLNVEDALEIIEGLTIGIKECLANQIPYCVED